MEREKRREEEDLGFFCAPLRSGSLLLHGEINPVKQAQSVDHKSNFLSSSAEQDRSPVPGSDRGEIKAGRGGDRTGVFPRVFGVFSPPAREVRPLRVRTQFVRRG